MRINPEGYEGIKINTAIFVLIIAVVTATALVCDWAWWVLALVDAFLVWRIVFFMYSLSSSLNRLSSWNMLI